MDIGQRALDYHNKGFNCAQSVFAACCEYTGMDEKTALALSAGFGGGARSGELCGAVTGAVMAEGLVFPFTDGQDIAAKDKIASIAKQCVSIAREKYGHVRCEELKGNIDCMEIIAFMAKTAEDIMNKEKT
ncbi:MAG: C-GCAxxG-C-C family protein [Clostridiales bacterium]|nr:C-GCAxxG-C-C family protein [Clostridiales bacterium]